MSQSGSQQKQVLILHADESVRKKLKDLIQETTSVAQITDSVDVKEAFAKLSRKTYDLLVVDYKAAEGSVKKLVQDIVADLNEADRPRYTLALADALDFNTLPQGLRNIHYQSKNLNETDLKNYFVSVLATVNQRKVDAAFIEPFITATLKVLEVTCKTIAEKEAAFVRKDDQISGDISAIIGMVSDRYKGSMGISFEKACFLHVVSQMLGEKYTELTEEIKDAAGEICNQVFGMAKTQLNSAGHRLQPAIPAVIAGDNHTIKHLVNGTCIAVKFKTEAGTFTVEAVVGSI